jgi:hypothetical protein
MGKVVENGEKVKAIALLFLSMLSIFSKRKKWLKMTEKLRLYKPCVFANFGHFSTVKWAKNRRHIKTYIKFFQQ